MNWKPNIWVTTLLGIFALPLSFLYIGRPVWAPIYVGASLLIGWTQIVYLHRFLPHMIFVVGVVIAGTAHACHLAARLEAGTPRPWYSRWYGLIPIGAMLFGVTVAGRAFLLEAFTIPSTAMLPTLPLGSYIVVSKWGYGNYRAFGVSIARTRLSSPIRRGDLLVFEYPRDASLDYVKRVVGLPGDRVSYANKQLSINGSAIPTKQVEDFWHSGRILVYSQFTEALDGIEYHVIHASYSEPPRGPLPQLNFPFSENCTVSTIGMNCEVPSGHLFVLGDNRDNSADSRSWGFVPLQNIVGKVLRVFP